MSFEGNCSICALLSKTMQYNFVIFFLANIKILQSKLISLVLEITHISQNGVLGKQVDSFVF